MDLRIEKLLDPTGRRLLRELQENARLSWSELGRRVGLSTPAVAERVRRMEEAGLIVGYRADVDAAKAGFPITAFIRLHTSPDRYPRVHAAVKSRSEVLECHHVTGSESFILRVAATSVGHLEEVIAQLSVYGETATSIVLSSPVQHRTLEPVSNE